MTLVRLLGAAFILALACPTVTAAQSDWDQAEREAIGDQTEDVRQAEELTGGPESESESGSGSETETETGSVTESEPEPEPEPESESESGLFGSSDRGGAISFFGDVGTFFGAINILGGAGAIGQTDGFSLSPWFGASYGVTDKLLLGAEWGFSMLAYGDQRFGMTTEGGGVAVTAGNPTVWGRWLPDGPGDRSAGGLSWGIDVGIGFPAASAGSTAQSTSIASAVGSRGAWDLWHWAPGAFTIVPGMFFDWVPTEGLEIRGEADLALLFGVNAAYETVGVLQLSLDGVYRFVAAMGLGLRLTGVLMGEDISPTRDTFQFAMAPYLAFYSGGFWLRGEFLLNLTDPYGTSFSDGKWWGARLIAGIDF